MGDVLADLPGA